MGGYMDRLLHCARWMVLLTIIGIMCPVISHAQSNTGAQLCAAPNYLKDVRPDKDGGPTKVTIGAVLADLLEISDVNQTISVDIAYRMQWTDPRLSSLAGCKMSIDDIWFPRLAMKNSGRIFKRWPTTVSIEEGGQVLYLQRMSGTFSGYQTLENFPFDPQAITLRIFPLEWSIEKVELVVDPSFAGIDRPLNISDWSVTGFEIDIKEENFPSVQQRRSALSLTVLAERQESYYIWKIILPIALIVVMSWCVFYINPKDFGTQLGLSASSVLTMVAFIFATTNMLPKLGYFTLLDRYVAGATIFVFVALLQSLVTGYLASKSHEGLATRIDLASRVLFPAVFVALNLRLYLQIT